MYCCGKKLEIPEWEGAGEGPNLIIVTCPLCSQQWAFTLWMHSWSKLEKGGKLMEPIKKNMRIVADGVSSNDIKVFDRDGNDVVGKIPIRDITIKLEATELNKAIFTFDCTELDIETEGFFQLTDGRPVIDFFKTLEVLIEQYNEEMSGKGSILHIDCLNDFYKFALNIENNSD